jgi:hypothetical protein
MVPKFLADQPMPPEKKAQIYKALKIEPPKASQVTLKGIVQGAENTAKENLGKVGAFYGANNQ